MTPDEHYMTPDEHYMAHGDPRALSYPLMDSPKPTVVFTLLYLVFVKWVGPALMRNRPPFQLKLLMAVYNIALVVFSGWVAAHLLYRWVTKYTFPCQPVDYSDDEDALHILYVCWLFYISKLVEFADTVFFVLRKKDSQVSFLHVIHHALTPMTLWFTVKYGAGGYSTFFCMNNSFVHTWMYLYYGLSGMGPGIQKYLWWKKHLTALQLVQFVVGFFYYFVLTFFPPEGCLISRFLSGMLLFLAVFYFCLFLNFYLQSYQKKPHKTK